MDSNICSAPANPLLLVDCFHPFLTVFTADDAAVADLQATAQLDDGQGNIFLLEVFNQSA